MLSGIYAPIPTPFDKSQEIDFVNLEANIKKWGKTSLTGLVVLGSNGEFVYLSNAEKEKLISFVREKLTGEKDVIAGTGCESTVETIRLTRKAADYGVSAVLVITPNYYKNSMTPKALEKYYLNVAESSPIPVVLYNMPGNTGINLSAETVANLAQHPNIIGIKDSSGNIVQISQVISNTSSDFVVFAGSASFLLPALIMGATGGTLALANIMPNECVKLFDLFHAGGLDEARKLQLRLIPINNAVTARWGVAGLKTALDLLGYYGGEPRKPVLPLGQNEKELLSKILKDAGCNIKDYDQSFGK